MSVCSLTFYDHSISTVNCLIHSGTFLGHSYYKYELNFYFNGTARLPGHYKSFRPGCAPAFPTHKESAFC
jgi:hypothetical protein